MNLSRKTSTIVIAGRPALCDVRFDAGRLFFRCRETGEDMASLDLPGNTSGADVVEVPEIYVVNMTDT